MLRKNIIISGLTILGTIGITFPFVISLNSCSTDNKNTFESKESDLFTFENFLPSMLNKKAILVDAKLFDANNKLKLVESFKKKLSECLNISDENIKSESENSNSKLKMNFEIDLNNNNDDVCETLYHKPFEKLKTEFKETKNYDEKLSSLNISSSLDITDIKLFFKFTEFKKININNDNNDSNIIESYVLTQEIHFNFENSNQILKDYVNNNNNTQFNNKKLLFFIKKASFGDNVDLG